MARGVEDFTELLFGKRRRSLNDVWTISGEQKPTHTRIFNILFRSYSWNPKMFTDLGISLSKDALTQMRWDMQEIIFKWIRLSTYKVPLVHSDLIRLKKEYVPEVKMVYSMLFSARIKTGNPDLTLMKF